MIYTQPLFVLTGGPSGRLKSSATADSTASSESATASFTRKLHSSRECSIINVSSGSSIRCTDNEMLQYLELSIVYHRCLVFCKSTLHSLTPKITNLFCCISRKLPCRYLAHSYKQSYSYQWVSAERLIVYFYSRIFPTCWHLRLLQVLHRAPSYIDIGWIRSPDCFIWRILCAAQYTT